jgi:N-acetylglucosaminyldiphosphoundecaprenol N-acetyl-beta-D-mannosaminyltransferase
MIMERIEFLGCPVDNICIDDALEWMDTRIKNHEPGKILVLNANKLWLMSKNPRLDQIVKKAELIIPEWAVFWGAKRLGTPLKACVYGIVLARETLQWAQLKGYRLFFLGAKPLIMDALITRIKKEYPEVQIAGYHHGYLDQAETQAVITEIIQSRPDVLLVAMGSPKQEYWISDHISQYKVPISIGIGGSFDVLAGIKNDTPAWARGHGLEWLYRLLQNPKAYWKRYLITNSWIIWNVFKALSRTGYKSIQHSYVTIIKGIYKR